MAVLIEGISVVVRCSAIAERFPGAWPAFRDAIPNTTLCCDNELARIGFMAPDDANAHIERLSAQGILYLAEGKARDLVIADQQYGLTAPCDWAEFGRVDWAGDPKKKIAACRAVGSQCRQVYTPEGWAYETSLSSQYRFVADGWVPEFMQFLRRENGLDVYRDLETGREVFVGRSHSSTRGRGNGAEANE